HDPQHVVKRPVKHSIERSVQPSPSEEPQQAVQDCIRAFVDRDYAGCVRQVMALAPGQSRRELWLLLLISLGRLGAAEKAEQVGSQMLAATAAHPWYNALLK